MSTRTFTFSVAASTNWATSLPVNSWSAAFDGATPTGTQRMENVMRIAANTPGAVSDPDPVNTLTYTGGVFASEFGSLGSLLIMGGGRVGWAGNEIKCWDIATRTWSRLNPPGVDLYPTPNADQWNTTTGEIITSDALTLSYYPTASNATTGVGPASTGHHYNQLAYIPSAVSGTTYGAVFRPTTPAPPTTLAAQSTRQSHRFRLDTMMYERASSSLTPSNTAIAAGPGCYVPSVAGRAPKYWWFQISSNPVRSLNLTTGVWATERPIVNNGTAQSSVAVYVPTIDRIVLMNPLDVTADPFTEIAVINPNNPTANTTPVTFKPTGGPSKQGNNWGLMSATWCADLGKILVYPMWSGSTNNASMWNSDLTYGVPNTGRIFTLTPPSNPDTDAWVWGTLGSLNSIPPCWGGVAGRFQYIPALKGCVLVTTNGVSTWTPYTANQANLYSGVHFFKVA